MRLYSKEYNNFIFYIAGEGPHKRYIKNYVKKNKLDKQVKLIGQVNGEKKNNFFVKLDLFIHTSRSEGIPNAVLEASAIGVPSLISYETNMADDFIKNKCGIVLEENSALNIYNKLINFEKLNKKEILRLKLNSIKMIKNDFNWKKIIKKMLNFLYK